MLFISHFHMPLGEATVALGALFRKECFDTKTIQKVELKRDSFPYKKSTFFQSVWLFLLDQRS